LTGLTSSSLCIVLAHSAPLRVSVLSNVWMSADYADSHRLQKRKGDDLRITAVIRFIGQTRFAQDVCVADLTMREHWEAEGSKTWHR
jgi:protein gp37